MPLMPSNPPTGIPLLACPGRLDSPQKLPSTLTVCSIEAPIWLSMVVVLFSIQRDVISMIDVIDR